MMSFILNLVNRTQIVRFRGAAIAIFTDFVDSKEPLLFSAA